MLMTKRMESSVGDGPAIYLLPMALRLERGRGA